MPVRFVMASSRRSTRSLRRPTRRSVRYARQRFSASVTAGVMTSAQETFLRVLRQTIALRSRGDARFPPPTTWPIAIARNVCLEQTARQRRARQSAWLS
jgi:DNA-directed RNA polymerase specialized sigma24 family protein